MSLAHKRGPERLGERGRDDDYRPEKGTCVYEREQYMCVGRTK